MLVRFKSEVGGFTMFGSIAQQLLRMAGHSGTVPGAIPSEGMAEALSRLRAALDKVPDDDESSGDEAGDGDGEPAVSLRRRAYPLLDLMQRAVAEESGIHWDTP